MSFRVRFSQETPGITYVPSQLNNKSSSCSLLADILSKPMPTRYPENSGRYNMDACTAASIGDELTLQKLLKINASTMSMKNQDGWTPLHYAAYLGHCGVISFLLDNGARVDEPNLKGQTALMMAAACGNTNAVRLLLERGANVRMMDREKKQALHYAASCSQNVAADTLIQAGADPNALDSHGMTPLHEAALSGHELTFLCILEKGGNVDLENLKGETAAHLACDNNKISQIISDHKKEMNSSGNGNANGKTPKTLAELLNEMDLSRYIDQFRHENIDLSVFFELKKEDFDDMKIPYGPKKRMLDVIEKYRTTGIIRPDGFETSPSPSVCQNLLPPQSENCRKKIITAESNDEKLIDTLRSIRDINNETKRYAMEALEAVGAGRTDRIRQLLIGIVDSVERITVKVCTQKI